jgi:uncharacterized protein
VNSLPGGIGATIGATFLVKLASHVPASAAVLKTAPAPPAASPPRYGRRRRTRRRGCWRRSHPKAPREIRVGYHEAVEYEWDDTKAASNLTKHGVSFEEALTVFGDPLAVIFDDEYHSIGESREIIIGHSSDGQLVLVCFVEGAGVVRIISARPATRRERSDYEENTRT